MEWDTKKIIPYVYSNRIVESYDSKHIYMNTKIRSNKPAIELLCIIHHQYLEPYSTIVIEYHTVVELYTDSTISIVG